jgi:pimeloyl-ACP methyl ester carboxylesterase
MLRRDCSKVVLVPGIMGSELILEDVDPSKPIKNRLIWSGDVNVLWQSIAEEPEILSSKNVRAGKVLRYLTGFSIPLFGLGKLPLPKRTPLYGPLFEHLVDEYNFQEGESLLEFGYDWRSCNAQSAQLLNEFLLKRTEPEDRVVLIAHSMGGLVCRALLADPAYSHLEPRIAKVIQLGTPVLGSAKAFMTLKSKPELHVIFDTVLKQRHRVNPELYHHLRVSLERFQALFQMLPPGSERIVFDNMGKQYSALHQKLWREELTPLLKGAEAFHTLIRGLASEKLFALYSTKVPTDGGYLVNDLMRLKGPYFPRVLGDGTVSIASASAQTTTDNLIPCGKITHDALPIAPEVWRSLERLL